MSSPRITPSVRFWRICVVASILLLIVPVIARYLWLQGVNMPIWIRPPSLPPGFYQAMETDSIQVGDVAVVCVDGPGGLLALRRRYVRTHPLAPFRCPHAQAPMAKIIAGLPGDTIIARRDSVKINSLPWLHAPMRPADSQGRLLTAWTGKTVLGQTECYALSLWSPLSYDSRYFGPFACPPHPVRIAYPVSARSQAVVDSLRKEIRGGL